MHVLFKWIIKYLFRRYELSATLSLSSCSKVKPGFLRRSRGVARPGRGRPSPGSPGGGGFNLGPKQGENVPGIISLVWLQAMIFVSAGHCSTDNYKYVGQRTDHFAVITLITDLITKLFTCQILINKKTFPIIFISVLFSWFKKAIWSILTFSRNTKLVLTKGDRYLWSQKPKNVCA